MSGPESDPRTGAERATPTATECCCGPHVSASFHLQQMQALRKEVAAAKFALEEDYQDRLRRINVLAIHAAEDIRHMRIAFTFDVSQEMLYTMQRQDLVPDLVARAADQFADFLHRLHRRGAFPPPPVRRP